MAPMESRDPLKDLLRLTQARRLTRRHFLKQAQLALGALALGELLARDAKGAAARRSPLFRLADDGGPLAPRAPTFAPKAKAVIYLHLSGAPPQHDLFDWKPKLVELDRKPCPDELLKGMRFAFIKGHPIMLASPYKFARHGASGAWVSELLPQIGSIVDDLCLVKSMRTSEFNHAPAELFVHTGDRNAGAASMGSWVTWGLGSANHDLPGFIVMVSGGTDPTGGKSLWSAGPLPSVHQGVQCRSGKEPVFYVNDPPGMSRASRRETLDALEKLNELEHQELGDPETLTRIEQYELAFRMQLSVPDLMDLKSEPKETLALYGADPETGSFANNCLLARRMVERGVRYVQLFDWGWDTHGTGPGDDIVTQLPKKCLEMDRPVAALIKDLKRRGMLDETLVVWGGEFGRTAMNEARDGSKFLGRDHHPGCFTIFLAGGGAKAGVTIGATDEFGYSVTETPIDVHDLQATLLHMLGLDAHRLSYPWKGLNQRLIGPADDPRVRDELLA
jgi:uncharacterized protein DUF1501